MKVTQEEIEQALDETLIEYIQENTPAITPVRSPGFGITAKEYAQRVSVDGVQITEDKARQFLNQLVKSGKLVKQKMLILGSTGSIPYVYFKPEENGV